MGEIAEMMLDGTLDCETGEYLGDGPGYPRTADSFAKDPYLYAYDDGGKKSRNSRKPKGRMGKATKRLFSQIYMVHHLGPFCPEKNQMPQIWALVDRKIIKQCFDGETYEFTKSGKRLGVKLFAVGDN